jgi:DNA-binding CsgD family transcriptional regulator
MIFMNEILARAQGWQLTRRETDTLIEVLRGGSNKVIAGRLGISAETVNKHLDNVYLKAEVHSRGELAGRFLMLG